MKERTEHVFERRFCVATTDDIMQATRVNDGQASLTVVLTDPHAPINEDIRIADLDWENAVVNPNLGPGRIQWGALEQEAAEQGVFPQVVIPIKLSSSDRTTERRTEPALVVTQNTVSPKTTNQVSSVKADELKDIVNSLSVVVEKQQTLIKANDRRIAVLEGDNVRGSQLCKGRPRRSYMK
ncbi:hypothetical protein ON010_g9879 [Phytophthora cinnamomi]|nr:hypothetical protein ON010_g9879 [Phytophthora cinnamomi]